MFGISGFELFIILLFGFLIFGPDKLPEIAKTVGKGIAKFRNAQADMTEQLKDAALFDKDSDKPFKNPIDVMENATSKAKSGAQAAKDGVRKAADKAAEHSEGFAERKARYERERAAKRAASRNSAQEESTSTETSSPKEPERRAPSVASIEDAEEGDPKVDVPAKPITAEED